MCPYTGMEGDPESDDDNSPSSLSTGAAVAITLVFTSGMWCICKG